MFFLLPSMEIFSQTHAREEIINSEYHFTDMASATTTRQAFLSHLAMDGLVVQRGEFVNGIHLWQNRQPDSSLLSWYPAFIDVASSGDLGLSTGPWEFRKDRKDSAVSASGEFISIWRKQRDGKWEVAVDIGIAHDFPQHRTPPLDRPAEGQVLAENFEPPGMFPLNTELAELETEINERCRTEGASALTEYLSEESRVFRQGEFPFYGIEASAFVLNSNEQYSCILSDGEIARSGDWAYAYGSVRFETTDDRENRERKAVYLRVWKKDRKSDWKVILEVISS